MRHSLALTAALAALAWAAPASAQMCGGSPSTTGATANGGGMCGMTGRSATASDPMASPGQQQGQRAAGGCPCCRNMAMMQGGMGGMMGGGSGSDSGSSGGGMGGMQMPSQPSTPQTTPGAPETPRPQ